MKAEIIAVGSEMLTPDHLDTNSLFLTDRLNSAGLEVHLKTVVGDNALEISEVLRSALLRSVVIVLCGGLGPTEDDLTRTAVASVLGRAVSPDPNLVERLRRRFASRGYEMPKINERQAEIIQGAEILENSFGTAPGMWIDEKGVRVVLLPGPPREMKAMFDERVLPRLRDMGRGRRLAKASLLITGMTESEVDSRAAPVYKSYSGVDTTVLASPGHIAIHISEWVEAGKEPEDLEELASRLREVLGDAVFSTSGESLEQVVGRLLREAGLTLAVAESCTSGMVGMRITRVPGSSDYFLGGVLCYRNDVKMKLCGVSEEILKTHGAVSAQAAEALAAGVRENLNSSIGLSVTGIAGPGGGTADKPVGLVFVGLSDGGRTANWRRVIPGDRESIRERASYLALSLLRRFLLDR